MISVFLAVRRIDAGNWLPLRHWDCLPPRDVPLAWSCMWTIEPTVYDSFLQNRWRRRVLPYRSRCGWRVGSGQLQCSIYTLIATVLWKSLIISFARGCSGRKRIGCTVSFTRYFAWIVPQHLMMLFSSLHNFNSFHLSSLSCVVVFCISSWPFQPVLVPNIDVAQRQSSADRFQFGFFSSVSLDRTSLRWQKARKEGGE